MKQYFEALENCNVCGAETEISRETETEQLICPNPLCKGKEYSYLKKWNNVVFKESNGIGESTIQTFHECGLIQTPADYYKLKADQISVLPRFGDRKAEIILGVIAENREISLENFIGGLNIPNFGRRMAVHLINAGIDSLEKMKNISIDELIKVDGVEKKTANTFKTNINQLETTINDLMSVGVTIISKQDTENFIEVLEHTLHGRSFCFTGAIQKEVDGVRLKRKDMQLIVKENSGLVYDKVKSGLDYLVQADPYKVSSKTKSALKHGTTIISEEDFFKMIAK